MKSEVCVYPANFTGNILLSPFYRWVSSWSGSLSLWHFSQVKLSHTGSMGSANYLTTVSLMVFPHLTEGQASTLKSLQINSGWWALLDPHPQGAGRCPTENSNAPFWKPPQGPGEHVMRWGTDLWIVMKSNQEQRPGILIELSFKGLLFSVSRSRSPS